MLSLVHFRYLPWFCLFVSISALLLVSLWMDQGLLQAKLIP